VLVLILFNSDFLQRGRIACNAELCIGHGNSFCLCVTCWYPIQRNEDRITRFSLWGSKNILVFDTNNGWGQRSLPLKTCAQSDPPPSEKHWLQQISAYNVSTVRVSEKSSITTNRKSTMCFLTIYRWSLYVTANSPRGWLKNRICHLETNCRIFS